MSFFHENMLIGSSGQGGAAEYQIERSLRFNSADSAYLSRTPASAGNRKTWTWAGWVKRTTQLNQTLFSVYVVGGNYTIFGFDGDVFRFEGDVPAVNVYTAALLRDPSAWYHVVLAVDTTQATAANRVKMYVNGVEQPYGFTSYPAQNADLNINTTSAHRIGSYNNARYLDGYLADVHFIDGQALTPSSFGEFDANNVWQPKAYTGTFTGNSFWLKFADNSAATATTLGKDSSGLGNNWTPNNLSVTSGAGNDSLVDSPTNYGTDTGAGESVRGNYCTWNPLKVGSGVSLVNGNLDWVSPAGGNGGLAVATIGVASGKWYWEATVTAGANCGIGVFNPSAALTTYIEQSTLGIAYYGSSGSVFYSGGSSAYGSSFGANDVIGVALDLDNERIYFAKNGTWQNSGNPATQTNPARTGLSGTYSPAINAGASGTHSASLNTGQRPFAYTAPSGFKALCTQNLPTPTITNGATAMDAVLYTGNGTSQTISGLGFSPDLVWIKSRSQGSTDHKLTDSVRGTTKSLASNSTSSESTDSGGLTAFTSDGFTVGSGAAYNSNTNTFVSWNWDAGSSTVTNTDGTISSQVRANTSAGFSIVTYTGTGTNATVGHGLNIAPHMVLLKSRTTAQSWNVYHTATGNTVAGHLNETAAFDPATSYWNNTSPTSTTFALGSSATGNGSGVTYVAYCFAPVAGYSAIGSYTGNGSTDGPFVFTDMRPRWIMLKRTDTTSSWTIIDTAREGYNVDNDPLYPNLTSAEGTTDLADILSNGFKLRSTDVSVNASAGTYIYACFSEHPFALARAR